ncbi:ABC transporter substrate-binding protein [Salinimonas marina]|uniref:ABC transporter substrate-binding protein n=1 Tax=Salinimonas marina TaxID=2785918 RepID=A0A7S9DYB3_9ALTE|nr:helical backbone metal receptor [Salinimonas marina]QPG06221.1 ABC transporter substrate-binding protein [Salinimonas marina]
MKAMCRPGWLWLFVTGSMLLWSHLISAKTVVTLSPHLAEWVYSLNYEDELLAVSAHSDYPPSAANKPVVASYHGVDIKAIMKLDPDLILAWQGGNKPQDIARLQSLGFEVFLSQPVTPEDIAHEINELGELLGLANQARAVTKPFLVGLKRLGDQYRTPTNKPVFYYLSNQPLMSVGAGSWPDRLLNYCGGQTIFADAPVAYPQVSPRRCCVVSLRSSLPPMASHWPMNGHSGNLTDRY